MFVKGSRHSTIKIMTAEGNCSTGMSHLRGYVDAVETLNESVDVCPSCSVPHDEMSFATPPTSPSYADSQDEKSRSPQFSITLTKDADNIKK